MPNFCGIFHLSLLNSCHFPPYPYLGVQSGTNVYKGSKLTISIGLVKEVHVAKRDIETMVVHHWHCIVSQRLPRLPFSTVLSGHAAALVHPCIAPLQQLPLVHLLDHTVTIWHQPVWQNHTMGVFFQVLIHQLQLACDKDLV